MVDAGLIIWGIAIILSIIAIAIGGISLARISGENGLQGPPGPPGVGGGGAGATGIKGITTGNLNKLNLFAESLRLGENGGVFELNKTHIF